MSNVVDVICNFQITTNMVLDILKPKPNYVSFQEQEKQRRHFDVSNYEPLTMQDLHGLDAPWYVVRYGTLDDKTRVHHHHPYPYPQQHYSRHFHLQQQQQQQHNSHLQQQNLHFQQQQPHLHFQQPYSPHLQEHHFHSQQYQSHLQQHQSQPLLQQYQSHLHLQQSNFSCFHFAPVQQEDNELEHMPLEAPLSPPSPSATSLQHEHNNLENPLHSAPSLRVQDPGCSCFSPTIFDSPHQLSQQQHLKISLERRSPHVKYLNLKARVLKAILAKKKQIYIVRNNRRAASARNLSAAHDNLRSNKCTAA